MQDPASGGAIDCGQLSTHIRTWLAETQIAERTGAVIKLALPVCLLLLAMAVRSEEAPSLTSLVLGYGATAEASLPEGYGGPELQDALLSCLHRYNSFEPSTPIPNGAFSEMSVVLEKKNSLERGAVALLGSELQAEVAEFLRDAPVSYEWEGFADGPLGEAGYAREYLSDNPETRLKPFLVALMLHRLRAAWECFAANGDEELAGQALEVYSLWSAEAQSSDDPLLVLIATEIDTMAGAYVLEPRLDWPGARQ